MPLIRTTPSDRTAYLRVNATSLTPVSPNLRRPASYSYSPRQVISPIVRASLAAKGASPANSVLGSASSAVSSTPLVIGPFGGSLLFETSYDPSSNVVGTWIEATQLSSSSLSPGTGDFTVAWWQYMDTSNEFPRIFCLGNGDELAVSIETGGEEEGSARTLYVWINQILYELGSVTINDVWAHIALVRQNGVVTVFLNGAVLGTENVPDNIQTSELLIIGGRTNTNVDVEETFEGYITNFTWIVGTAVYSQPFTPPLGNLGVVPGNRILLRADTNETKLVNSAPAGFVTLNAIGPLEWSSSVPS
jgi:hypothetical protein